MTQQRPLPTGPSKPIAPAPTVPFGVELPDRFPVDTAAAVRIRLTGGLDIATTPLLTDVLDQLFAAGRRDVQVDLSGLNFLACAGLHVLDRADRRYRRAGGRLTLVSPNEMARRLVAITGLDLALHPAQG
jgi:anti-anti-sigma factor